MSRRNRYLDALAPGVRDIVRRRMEDLESRREDSVEAYEQILTDLDVAIEGHCACGCGMPITATSASAYYATPECQQRWMATHADDPGEVYGRRDAAFYPMADGGVQQLSEPGAAEHDLCGLRGLTFRAVNSNTVARGTATVPTNVDHVHVTMSDPGPPVQRTRIYGPGSFEDMLAYRCTCPDCDDFMEPLIFDVHTGVGDHISDPDYRMYLGSPEWQQECSSCHTAMVGTVHVPMIYPSREPPGWVLELHTTYGRVRSTITTLALDRMAGTPAAREAFIARTWADMERDLARFEREWRGRLNRRFEMQVSALTASPQALRIYYGNDTIT